MKLWPFFCSHFSLPKKSALDYSEKSIQFLEDFRINDINFGTYMLPLDLADKCYFSPSESNSKSKVSPLPTLNMKMKAIDHFLLAL